MTVHLFTHRDCLFHDNGKDHPEKADRLRMVWSYLDDEGFEDIVRHDASLAEEELLKLAHTSDYIKYIKEQRPVSGIIQLDPDTFMSPGSYDAALRAVGAVRDAVDFVLQGDENIAFCAARPPGHHAEQDKAMGFCLFNQIAIGAIYATEKHNLSRVAVMDFDVHHGNGTQAIFEKNPKLFYASTHQEAPFYPGTGHAHETGVGNILNCPLPEGSDGTLFRKEMTEKVIPALEAFNPDLLMISAGFDAHHADPRAGLKWTEEDYKWATEQLIDVARACSGGKIVSVMEGGYDLVGLAESAKTHVKALLAA